MQITLKIVIIIVWRIGDSTINPSGCKLLGRPEGRGGGGVGVKPSKKYHKYFLSGSL